MSLFGKLLVCGAVLCHGCSVYGEEYSVTERDAPVLMADMVNIQADVAMEFGGNVKQFKNMKGFTVDLNRNEAIKLVKKYPHLAIERVPEAEIQLDDWSGESCENPKEPKDEYPDYEVWWGVERVGADKTWEENAGEGVLIVVLDTGIDPDHKSFEGRIHKVVSLTGDDGIDRHSHGTHCASIAAGAPFMIDGKKKGYPGVAIKAWIASVKVLNNDGSGSMATIADGFLEAKKLCAEFPGKCVVSVSLGGLNNYGPLEKAVNELTAAGIPTICAAGNNPTGAVLYPAKYCFDAVSASMRGDNIAPFSTVGLEVDFIAPGMDIMAAIPGNLFARKSGTSMATPHVAGVVAQMLSEGHRTKPVGCKIGKLSEIQQGHGMISSKHSITHQD